MIKLLLGWGCRTLSFPILSYPILFFPILSYPFLSYPFLSFPILSFPFLFLARARLECCYMGFFMPRIDFCMVSFFRFLYIKLSRIHHTTSQKTHLTRSIQVSSGTRVLSQKRCDSFGCFFYTFHSGVKRFKKCDPISFLKEYIWPPFHSFRN